MGTTRKQKSRFPHLDANLPRVDERTCWVESPRLQVDGI